MLGLARLASPGTYPFPEQVFRPERGWAGRNVKNPSKLSALGDRQASPTPLLLALSLSRVGIDGDGVLPG